MTTISRRNALPIDHPITVGTTAYTSSTHGPTLRVNVTQGDRNLRSVKLRTDSIETARNLKVGARIADESTIPQPVVTIHDNRRELLTIPRDGGGLTKAPHIKVAQKLVSKNTVRMRKLFGRGRSDRTVSVVPVAGGEAEAMPRTPSLASLEAPYAAMLGHNESQLAEQLAHSDRRSILMRPDSGRDPGLAARMPHTAEFTNVVAVRPQHVTAAEQRLSASIENAQRALTKLVQARAQSQAAYASTLMSHEAEFFSLISLRPHLPEYAGGSAARRGGLPTTHERTETTRPGRQHGQDSASSIPLPSQRERTRVPAAPVVERRPSIEKSDSSITRDPGEAGPSTYHDAPEHGSSSRTPEIRPADPHGKGKAAATPHAADKPAEHDERQS